MTEEENEDVSVCSRYTKYPKWNSVLETQFLEDLVSYYPNTSGLDLDLYFETDLEDGGDQSRPLLQTPTWSLSLLEGDRLSPVKPVIIPIVQSSSKKKRKISGDTLSKSKLVKTSHYYNPEDWSALYLMQDLSGGRAWDHDSSPDLSSDSSSDDEAENTEDEFEQTEAEEAPSKAPVSDAIRRKIEQTNKTDRRLLKFRLERNMWKKYSYSKKVTNIDHLAILLRFVYYRNLYWSPL